MRNLYLKYKDGKVMRYGINEWNEITEWVGSKDNEWKLNPNLGDYDENQAELFRDVFLASWHGCLIESYEDLAPKDAEERITVFEALEFEPQHYARPQESK